MVVLSKVAVVLVVVAVVYLFIWLLLIGPGTEVHIPPTFAPGG